MKLNISSVECGCRMHTALDHSGKSRPIDVQFCNSMLSNGRYIYSISLFPKFKLNEFIAYCDLSNSVRNTRRPDVGRCLDILDVYECMTLVDDSLYFG